MLHTIPQNSVNDINLTSVAEDTTLPQFTAEPMASMKSSAGTKFMVPEAFLEFCEQLMRKNKTLRATSDTQGAASSTKVYEDRARNIRLQDTYTYQYPANSIDDDVSSPQVHYQDRYQPLMANRTRAWGEGGEFSRREVPQNRRTSRAEDSSLSRRNSPIVDVGLTVRKSNVSFSDDRGQSIEAFLDKVEACRGLTSLSEAEVFQALPELLNGVAAMSLQVEKHRWNTWSDFCSAARRWYGTGRGYQQRLLMEATARMQGEDELARDYITCLLVIIRKMELIPGLETQLDMLHRNLRLGLQRLVRRADFKDIDELQKMAREAELTLEMEKSFRPPPPPELTMLPEAAYKSRSAKPAKPKISGVDSGEYNGLEGKETSAD